LSKLQNKPYVLVSACLLGEKCRYDGESSYNASIRMYENIFIFVPFCPEQLGGLPTPRPASNIINGDGVDVLRGKAKVVNIKGIDVTENFKKGAYASLELAKTLNISFAIVKDKSPSCGLRTPYCEHPSGWGMGVTAALFKLFGIKMIELNKDQLLLLMSKNKPLNKLKY